MPASKAGALPLGDAPTAVRGAAYSGLAPNRKRLGARLLQTLVIGRGKARRRTGTAEVEALQLAASHRAHRLRLSLGLDPLGGD